MSKTHDSTWKNIIDRMNRAAHLLKDSLENPGSYREQILKNRAETLARKEKKEERSEFLEFVEFRLADEIYAVECLFVREVYPLKELIPLPGTPLFILGIVNVRGEIVSVVDIKEFFQMPHKDINDLTRVVILHHKKNGMEFGILAEEVLGTVRIAIRGIKPPQETLPTLTGVRADYLKGVTPDHRIVLDARKLLEDGKMIVHQEIE